jgi:flagellar protein FlbD
MVHLTRLNGCSVVVNAAHIVLLESTPDTLLTLSTGEKLLVRQTSEEVIAKVTEFLRSLGGGPIVVAAPRHQPESGT